MVEKFLADFQNGMPGLPSSFKNLVYNQLHRLYQAGIMNTPEYNAMMKDTTAMVRVVTGKEAQAMRVSSFYSTLSAYEQLFTTTNWPPSAPFCRNATSTNTSCPTSSTTRSAARPR